MLLIILFNNCVVTYTFTNWEFMKNKNKVLGAICILLCFLSPSIIAEEKQTNFGIDFGWAFIDIGAAKTAQNIANISGSTVTYTSDTGAFAGRIYGDYKISENIYGEVGYFLSGEVNAKYTLSGATASEAYSVSGLDFSGVYKGDSGFFAKGGIHSSTVDGKANITISGTSYAAKAAASGTGALFGFGFDLEDGSRYGYTFYSSLGGLADADVGLLYYGWRF